MSTKEFSPEEKSILRRFCTYGFLKNQQYYEPFIILAFIANGLSFTEIGTLVAIRSITTNFLEIPSGSLADVMGRKKSMIFSFVAYAISFTLYAFGHNFLTYVPAVIIFGIADSFRTGTHKAIIFDWLTHVGRKEEKTKVYGLTRSWSKMGSALSVIISTLILLSTQDYKWVFLSCVIPYLLNILNFYGYPNYLDKKNESDNTLKQVFATMWSTSKDVMGSKPLKRLMMESSFFDGFFNTNKDYLQPLLKALLITLPFVSLQNQGVSLPILVGSVYFVLYLGSSIASRQSHVIQDYFGNDNKAASSIWAITLLLYTVMGLGFYTHLPLLAVLSFALLEILRNVWKPIMLSRFYQHCQKESSATTLSIANQCKTLTLAVAAPALGIVIDSLGGWSKTSDSAFILWPVAAIGVMSSLLGLLVAKKHEQQQSC